MHEMTKQNLKDAFAGESQAHMKYLIFSDKAQKEGRPNIARLFKAISYAEQVHAANHLRALGMVQDTAANLDTAVAGENFEVTEMYPVHLETARQQSEKAAEKSDHYALEAEKIHAMMFQKAKETAAAGKDIVLRDVYICPVCGHTVEGEPEGDCPICKAKKGMYVKF